MDIRLKTLATSQFSKNTMRASAPDRFKSCCVRRSFRRSGDAFHLVVGLGGLEPPASPLSGVRSNHLSYRPISVALAGFGGACRDRTDDPLLAKQVLSQLS